MRFATMLFLLLVCAVPAAAEDEAEFLKHGERARASVAAAHVNLARQARRYGMFEAARAELQEALRLVPEFPDAMKELGFKRRKPDGEGPEWQPEEGRALPEKDADTVTKAHRDRFASARARMREAAAAEFVALARRAGGLQNHARAACQAAVAYDPTNEEALRGAGWQQDESGAWIDPAEHAEREATKKALAEAPEARALDELPAWAARVFEDGVWAARAGKVTVVGTGLRHPAHARIAHAAVAISASLLGGEVEDLRVVVCNSEDEYQKYCRVRHPGAPSLLDEWLVIENSEVAVRLTDDAAAGDERVAYAVARSQVLRRCGDSRHPWFSIGFAANLAQRLTGRISSTEFAGESTGAATEDRWKSALREMLDQGRLPPLGRVVVDRDPTEAQVMVAYFFTRYLCRERAAGLPAFCASVKADGDSEGALKAAFGESSEALGAKFAEWFSRR